MKARKEQVQISEELVERAKRGDQTAFTELYECTSHALYRTIRAVIHDEDLARDVQQDSYLRAFQSLDKLENSASFLPWLRRIAVNQAVTELNRRLPLTFTDLGGEEDQEPELPDPSPETQPELALDRKETARLVREILEGLSPGQHMTVGMYYYEGMTIPEIAESLHVTPGTVKTQLHLGRKRVEREVRALEKKGVKLYGLGPMAFLRALLRRLEPLGQENEKTKAAVLAGVPAGAGTAAVSAVTLSGSLLYGLGSIIAATLLALALLGGGVWGFDLLRKGRQPRVGDPDITGPSVTASTEPSTPTETRTQRLEQRPTEPEPPETPPTEPDEPEPEPSKPDEPEPSRPEKEEPEPSQAPEPSEPDGEPEDNPNVPGSETPSASPEASEQSSEAPEIRFLEYGAFGAEDAEEKPFTATLDLEQGLLTISGSGAMPDYHGESTHFPPPWIDERDQIREAVVTDGVSSLGWCTFMFCDSVLSLHLPKTLNNFLGYHIGTQSLCTVWVDPRNPWFRSDEAGVLYTADGTRLLYCPPGKQGSYTTLESTRSIGEEAFRECSGLTVVELPDSLASIETWAFEGCSGLSTLNLPAGLISIGHGAFEGCSGLTAVEFPAGLKEIGAWAFEGCSGLTAVQLPDGITVIEERLFWACSGLSYVKLPSGLKAIGKQAFADCTALTAPELPEGLTEIGERAFSGCVSLGSVSIPQSVTAIGKDAFSGCGDLTIRGFPGSEAQRYAEENGIPFLPLKQEETEP